MVESLFLLVTSAIINFLLHAMLSIQRPLERVVIADMHVHGSADCWTIARKRVSHHLISGAIKLETLGSPQPPTTVDSFEELVREIRREPVDGVLLSATPAEFSALSERLRAFEGLGSPVRFIVGSGERPFLRQAFANANSLYLLNTGAMPTTTLQYAFFKRTFDIAFSLTAIVLGSPVIALIALIVKASSKGDILFVQDRVGWNGSTFRMYKFRTMHQNQTCDSDTRWSQSNDSRQTAVGRVLRKYSLDELPQFFNVLKGDMSVVGPRPERPYFVNSFQREIDEYHRRHLVKVGITGWAQVNGLRGDTCIRTRLLYDLYYLQNWGLIFDLKIIFRTGLCVLFGLNND